jgi:hypothetical protein
MLNALISRNGLIVTTVIVACGFMVVTSQGRDFLSFKPAPEPEEIHLVDVSQAPNTAPLQTPPIASPSIEPELNDLGADLEAQAVKALELFAAPVSEEISEPTPEKR